MRVRKSLFRHVRMKRFSPNGSGNYPDPSKPPDGENHSRLTDGSKRVKTSQSFESLFDSETLSDITVDVNEGQYVFNAHKMILGIKSEVLAAELNDLTPASSEGERPVLCVQEPPECADVFCRFLFFVYSGTVWLHRDYVIALQRLAQKYEMQPLLLHCENFITQILNNTLAGCDIPSHGFHVTVVCSLYEDTTQTAQVRDLAFKVLCLCFTNLVQCDRWPTCSWQLVCDLLKSEYCQAEENVILTSATDWMKRNSLNDKARIEDILTHIKYPLLHKKVLYMMQKNGAFKNFPRVQELLNNAVKYHCFKDIPEAQPDFVGPQFMPRRRMPPIVTNENNNYAVEASPTSMRYSDSSSREDITYMSTSDLTFMNNSVNETSTHENTPSPSFYLDKAS
ncbi:BTB/POZ domain-containing protein 17-like [Mya arenaria]|uniref:BTB/POZ domain-containing protein 17-like n=1 Tax=Mya arenaria TaxID=6604 RepID=UPI0022E009AF|nr:BTB/POZ domain-containing protein 17-like [Mya arenaria]XP_052759627.1 BTB/POZ domain-containing protein 17-like [Mya arenaria]XP_052759634.1 BTB/POZ domain-containing protein 17-like [Mya arenaria]XP_052759644.1 BTB/POZ domain-containing protein 17-like [Mya arenaria]